MEIRFLEKENFSDWNKFVEQSQQGTIYSSTYWLDAFEKPFKILGCYENKKLIGGIAFFTEEDNIITPKPTRFQGILFLKEDVSQILIEKLIKDYKNIFISNHVTLEDISFFIQNGFSSKVKYTYLVNISDLEKTRDKFEKRTRYEIRKAEKSDLIVKKEDNILAFDKIHQLVFKKQNRSRPISTEFIVNLYKTLKEAGKCQLYFAYNKKELSAAVLIIWDNKRGYYLMGASDPKFKGDGASSLALWTAFKDLKGKGFKEIDLLGANIPSIKKFKRGFGGELKSYFNVKKMP